MTAEPAGASPGCFVRPCSARKISPQLQVEGAGTGPGVNEGPAGHPRTPHPLNTAQGQAQGQGRLPGSSLRRCAGWASPPAGLHVAPTGQPMVAPAVRGRHPGFPGRGGRRADLNGSRPPRGRDGALGYSSRAEEGLLPGAQAGPAQGPRLPRAPVPVTACAPLCARAGSGWGWGNGKPQSIQQVGALPGPSGAPGLGET